MRLPCPVGHYDLLSIEGENLPPSLLTPPCVDRRGILQLQYCTLVARLPSLASCVTHPRP